MKLSSYCLHDLKMIIFYWGHARLIFYQSYGPLEIFQQWVLSLQLLLQFLVDFNDTFQLLFPWPEEGHIKLRSHLTAFYQNYSLLPFITIEKPCQHNILINTWARILIIRTWLRINIYMTWLTFEHIPWNIEWVMPLLRLCNYNSRKILSTRYLENCWS